MLFNQTPPMLTRYTFSGLLFLLLMGTAIAQPTLQSSDLPSAAVTMNLYTVSSPGTSNPAPNGANITWDFSSAQFTQLGTSTLGPASATPFAAQVPTANWSLSYNLMGLFQTYNYFRSTSSLFELLADGLPDDPVIYSNAKQILQFPFSYQGMFTDTYQNDDGGGGTVQWVYGGYGTVISSLGTFTNVAKVTSSEGDIVFWRVNPLHPLIIIDGEAILVFAPGGVGMDEAAAGASIKAWPNPLQDELWVSGVEMGSRYMVVDALGRAVAEGSFTESGTSNIGLSAVAPGNYHLRIWNAAGINVLPLVKQ
jgi:hypothetical protein